MLLPIVKSTSTGGTAKQISVPGLPNSTIMYTVATGKTFVGFAISVSGQMGLCVNGNAMQMTYPAAWITPIPLTLVAGSVVTSQGSYYNWMLIGVES